MHYGGVREFPPVGGGGGGLDDAAVEAAWPRLAVRHWLDPHPDAAAFDETWEFSTTGDMTQGELEAAGWTFSNCTAEVANGLLVLTASSAAVVKASLGVSFTGDFDFVVTPQAPYGYDTDAPAASGSHYWGGGGVGDTVNDVAHYIVAAADGGRPRVEARYNGAYSTLGGASLVWNLYGMPIVLRVWRVSAAVRWYGGIAGLLYLQEDETSPSPHGWSYYAGASSVSDSDTFQKMFLTFQPSSAVNGSKVAFSSIRRFQ